MRCLSLESHLPFLFMMKMETVQTGHKGVKKDDKPELDLSFFFFLSLNNKDSTFEFKA